MGVRMDKISVTKAFTFDSAHFLEGYEGACANLHGHTYKCEVTVVGPRDSLGMIIDFKDLKQLIQRNVMQKFDHKCVNDIVGYNPTAENMVEDIALNLGTGLGDHHFVTRVKLWETPDSYATWERVE